MDDNKVVDFENGFIDLEDSRAVYYSGQILNGAVVFNLSQPQNFSSLNIQFLGEAKVLWTETETETIRGHEREREIEYRAREEYFNYTQTLAGGNGVSQLPSTQHSFPFKFQIPFTAPSSFKSEKGSITYTIIATVSYPDMIKPDQMVWCSQLTKEFTVVAPMDLNTGHPRLKEPIDLEFEEVYSCNCICSSDPVTIRIRLPVTGYCPGQTIPVAVEVQNQSSVEITKMIFQLLTRELYRSTQPPSEYIVPEKVLATAQKGAVLAHSKRNFTCDIVVPDMIVPYLEHCSIIDIGYFFRVTIKLSGCNDELQDEAEICLGLVPIKETLEAEYIHPVAHNLPAGPIPVNTAPVGLTAPPMATPRFFGSNTSINRSQHNIAQSQNYPSYPGANTPYPNQNQTLGFTGSNSNINRSQQNIAHNASYQDLPPPYPGNAPYPAQNISYDIGFKSPDISFPGVTPNINISPYPGDIKPSVYPPYPTNSGMPQVHPINYPPVPQNPHGAFVPTAPPSE